MTVIGNRLKTPPEPTPKEVEKEIVKEKKVKKNPGQVPEQNLFHALIDFMGDKKTHFLFGTVFILLSFYLAVAFTSFTFTWRADYSEVSGSWMNFLKSSVQAENWLGKLGAIVSHQFIFNWFGIVSYVFALLFLVTGCKIAFKVSILPVRRTYVFSFFFLVTTSITLGFLFDLRWLGGGFGFYANSWLNTVVGNVGTGLLLFTSYLIFTVLAFKLPTDFSKKKTIEQPVESTEVPTENVLSNDVVIQKGPNTVIRPTHFEPSVDPDDLKLIVKPVITNEVSEIEEKPKTNLADFFHVKEEEVPEPEITENRIHIESEHIQVADTIEKLVPTPEPAIAETPVTTEVSESKAMASKGPLLDIIFSTEELEQAVEFASQTTESQDDLLVTDNRVPKEGEEDIDPDSFDDDQQINPDEEDVEDEDEHEDEEGDFDDEEEEDDQPQQEFVIEEKEEFDIISNLTTKPASDISLSIEIPETEQIETVETENNLDTQYDPTLDLSSYKFPHLDLLENYGTNKIQVDREELEENKNRIVETLGHYNIDIDKIKATIGPTVTLYEIVPKAGVRISKIKNLEDDIALSLSALGIRIIAPIPGKGTIGIEVPNQKPEIVSMRSILASEKFQNSDMELPVGLGKTISNEVFVADLAKMPHLLMAGATGQGKSVGLNALLVSLLYKKHPSQVKFVLVDPKKVELTLFKTIERHFLAKLPGEGEAIITDTKKVINTLNSLCIEMDQRYDLLKNAQVRNIKEYNAKFVARRLNPNNGHRFLPYIILVVDEFADLIMTAGKEVEMPIARLAQLARAIGIHLIIATQRPSVNIITGTIKANFPARIAFRVTSKIDSRTILDAGGADQLIGRGDLLYSTGADLTRIQCAFVDTPEVEKITDYIGSQRGYGSAFLLPEYVDEKSEGNVEFNASDRDVFFEEAARIIVQHQQGSASLLQRRLKLGYNRAGRIIDQLESAGIIGPFEGSKAREVLLKTEMELENFLSNMKG